jgi:hypothetical protein
MYFAPDSPRCRKDGVCLSNKVELKEIAHDAHGRDDVVIAYSTRA